MTDSNLMDADCIHGIVWYDCEICDSEIDIPENSYETEFDEELGF